MIGSALMIGTISALGFYILLWKVGIRYIVKYELFLDVVVTVICCLLLSGSTVGITGGLLGGLFFSVLLVLSRTFAQTAAVNHRKLKEKK